MGCGQSAPVASSAAPSAATGAPALLLTPGAAALPAPTVPAGVLLTIGIIQARSLLAADVSGASDPYVVISLPGTRAEPKRTKKRMHTLNPVFNERVAFVLPSKPASIHIAVYDFDTLRKDRCIGEADYALPASAGDPTSAPLIWLPLLNKGAAAGEVQLQVVVRPSAEDSAEHHTTFAESLGLTTLSMDELTQLQRSQLKKFIPSSVLSKGKYRLRIALTHGNRVFNGRAVDGIALTGRGVDADDAAGAASPMESPTGDEPTADDAADGGQAGSSPADADDTIGTVVSAVHQAHPPHPGALPIEQDCRVWIRTGEEKYVVKVVVTCEYTDMMRAQKSMPIAQGYINTAVLQDGTPREFHVALHPYHELTDSDQSKMLLAATASASAAPSASGTASAATVVAVSATALEPPSTPLHRTTSDGSGFRGAATPRGPAEAASHHAPVVHSASMPASTRRAASGMPHAASEHVVVREGDADKSVGTLIVRAVYQDRDSLEQWFFDRMLHDFDADGNGQLSYGEFALLLATLEEQFHGRIGNKEQLFGTLDGDASGMLDRPELLRWLMSAEFHSSPMAYSILAFLSDGVEGMRSLVNNVSHVSRSAKASTADGAGIVEVNEGGRIVKDTLGLKIFDRYTGLIVEEFIPSYVRAAIKAMYDSSFGSLLTTSLPAALKSLSQVEGRHNDDPASKHKIADFVKAFNINVDEVAQPLESYPHFNAFFYRELKPGARPVAEPSNPAVLVSPADCRMVVYNTMLDATQVWVKGAQYTVERLLGPTNADVAPLFLGGALCVARLAPQDYHRWHSPVSGRFIRRTKIDGALYTVNPMAIRRARPDVYTENKREVYLIQTRAFGLVAMVAVGATCVGSINVVPEEETPYMRKGECHGYFAFGGSTVLVLFQPNVVHFDADLLKSSAKPLEVFVRVGDHIGVASARADGAAPLPGTLSEADPGYVLETTA